MEDQTTFTFGDMVRQTSEMANRYVEQVMDLYASQGVYAQMLAEMEERNREAEEELKQQAARVQDAEQVVVDVPVKANADQEDEEPATVVEACDHDQLPAEQ